MKFIKTSFNNRIEGFILKNLIFYPPTCVIYKLEKSTKYFQRQLIFRKKKKKIPTLKNNSPNTVFTTNYEYYLFLYEYHLSPCSSTLSHDEYNFSSSREKKNTSKSVIRYYQNRLIEFSTLTKALSFGVGFFFH